MNKKTSTSKGKEYASKLLKVRNILIGVASGLGATTIASTGTAIYFATKKVPQQVAIIEGDDLIVSSCQATYSILDTTKDWTWNIQWLDGEGDISISENGVVTTAWDAYGVAEISAKDKNDNTIVKIVGIYPPYVNSEQTWIHKDSTWAYVDIGALSTASTTEIQYFCIDESSGTIQKNDFQYDIYIGDNITKIPDNFCEKMSSYNGKIIFSKYSKCSVIGKCFMQDCKSFDKELTLPETVDFIDDGFLDGCVVFNNEDRAFVLPTNLTMIGEWFMHGCVKFNKPYTIPQTVTRVGDNFMADCGSMSGSVITIECDSDAFSAYGDDTLVTESKLDKPVYISGSDADNFLARFPDKTTAPYRKLAKKVEL